MATFECNENAYVFNPYVVDEATVKRILRLWFDSGVTQITNAYAVNIEYHKARNEKLAYYTIMLYNPKCAGNYQIFLHDVYAIFYVSVDNNGRAGMPKAVAKRIFGSKEDTDVFDFHWNDHYAS